MGLRAKPNQHPPNKEQTTNSVIQLFDVPDSDATTRTRKQRHALDLDEERYIAACMAKHGDDYVAMFRDIKVNSLQYTENRLRKLGSRFLVLAPEHRRVQVPQKVAELVSNDSRS